VLILLNVNKLSNSLNVNINDNVTQKSQIMNFVDHSTEWKSEMVSNPDATYNIAHNSDADIKHFLSRPVMIKNYAWQMDINGGQVGSNDTDRVFNPWSLFFQNARVKEKIDHFNLIRCKLHVKFMINGNPFFYGRVMPSYTPLSSFDDFYNASDTSDLGTTSMLEFVPASQKQKIFLDPSTSQGGEMVLPFLFPANAMSIPNSDWSNMGHISMFTIVPLLHANGQTTGEVDIQVFAWAEDVTLSVPTSYVPQMGQVNDEYQENGLISKALNAISVISGSLAKFKTIAPYARATQMVSAKMADIAAFLGYSRPAVVTDIQKYVPHFFGNLANTEGAETVHKLTLDPKQETTIDTRVVGLDGTDELIIKDIAKRESLIELVQWSNNEDHGSLLWNTEVSPVMWQGSSILGYTLPACSFAALPFKYWRGTINYRFQVIASAYHKGRMRVIYDPYYVVGSPEDNANVAYSMIVDLDKTRDFTVPVGWGQQWSMLRHRDPSFSANPMDSISRLTSSPGEFGNGVLRLEVMNELTSPGPTETNVHILISVSASDDFEVFEPTAAVLNRLSFFEPQMGEVTQSQAMQSQTTQDENSPNVSQQTESLATTLECDHTNSVFFGDPVVSFRQVLKRYNGTGAFSASRGGTGTIRAGFVKSDFPAYFGFDPNGEYGTATQGNFNFSASTLLNYCTPAFVQRRGGLRWKYYLSTTSGGDYGGYISASRISDRSTVTRADRVMSNPSAATNKGEAAKSFLPYGSSATTNGYHTLPGSTITPKDNNPVIEIELPWYTNRRFAFARQLGTHDNSGTARIANNFHFLEVRNESVSSYPSEVLPFVSVAEDFQLSAFIGLPKWYPVETLPNVT
jgi:hypothetical protein